MIRSCACPAVIHVVAVVAAAAAVCQLTLALVYCHYILLLPMSAFLLLQLQLSNFVAIDAGLAVAEGDALESATPSRDVDVFCFPIAET